MEKQIDSTKHSYEEFGNRCLFDLWCAYNVGLRIVCSVPLRSLPTYNTPKHIYEIPVITAL